RRGKRGGSPGLFGLRLHRLLVRGNKDDLRRLIGRLVAGFLLALREPILRARLLRRIAHGEVLDASDRPRFPRRAPHRGLVYPRRKERRTRVAPLFHENHDDRQDRGRGAGRAESRGPGQARSIPDAPILAGLVLIEDAAAATTRAGVAAHTNASGRHTLLRPHRARLHLATRRRDPCADALVQVLQIFGRGSIRGPAKLGFERGDLIDQHPARTATDHVGLDDPPLLRWQLAVPVGEEVFGARVCRIVSHRRNLDARIFSTSSSKASRARANRDMTVPIGISNALAISAYGRSPSTRRARIERCSSESRSRACSTSSRFCRPAGSSVASGSRSASVIPSFPGSSSGTVARRAPWRIWLNAVLATIVRNHGPNAQPASKRGSAR